MSVITEVRIPSDGFELGHILDLDESSAIELETLVPNGNVAVPYFWIYGAVEDQFLETVRCHLTVNSVTEVDGFGDRTLFRLDWDPSQDDFFQYISDHGGQILSATGTPEKWDFGIRFPPS